MTKKQLLIIFLLAALLTGLSWFITTPSEMVCLPLPVPFIAYSNGCAKIVLPKHMNRGYPITYWKDSVGLRPFQISFLNLGANFLFWFLVLAVGWGMVKRINRRNK